MTKSLCMAALATALLVPSAAHAEATAQPTAPHAAADVKSFDQRLAAAQAKTKRMQAQMDRVHQTQDPQERQRLLQEHYATCKAR